MSYESLSDLFESLEIERLNEFVFRNRKKLQNKKFLLKSIRLTKENLFFLKAFDVKEYNLFYSLKKLGYKEIDRFRNEFNFPSRELWVLSNQPLHPSVKKVVDVFKSGKSCENLKTTLKLLQSKSTTDKEKLLLLWVLSTQLSEKDLTYMIDKSEFSTKPTDLKKSVMVFKLMNLIKVGTLNRLRDYCGFIPTNAFSSSIKFYE